MKRISMMALLSLAAASAMAESTISTISTSTITKTTGTLDFYTPVVVTTSVDTAPILGNRKYILKKIGTITASESGATVDGIAVAGDYNAADYSEDPSKFLSWTVPGINDSSHTISVELRPEGGATAYGIAQKYGTDHFWIGSDKKSITVELEFRKGYIYADKYEVNFYAAAFLS